MRSIFSLGAVTIMVSLTACGRHPLKVEVRGDEHSLSFHDPSDKRQVKVRVLDQDGNPIRAPELRWYVKNPRVAEVSPLGVIVPKNEGHTEVVVRSGYAQREIPVTVHFFASVEPSVKRVTIPLDEAEELTARVLDQRGREVEAAEVVWTSKDPHVAAVEEGAVIGAGVGHTTVVGRAGAVQTEVEVEVTPSGETPAS
jgi:hypothetical protein